MRQLWHRWGMGVEWDGGNGRFTNILRQFILQSYYCNHWENPELKLITECIVREYQPDKIILFGSWARGDADEQSDLDLLVISDREKELPRYKRGLDVRLLLSQFQSPKDILFYTHEDVDHWRDIPHTFINTVLNEGRALYER